MWRENGQRRSPKPVARKGPVAHHIHDEDEYMLVLSGCVMLEDAGLHTLLDPGSCFRIQSGHFHGATPLGGDVQTLVTFIPAGPLFSGVAAINR